LPRPFTPLVLTPVLLTPVLLAPLMLPPLMPLPAAVVIVLLRLRRALAATTLRTPNAATAAVITRMIVSWTR